MIAFVGALVVGATGAFFSDSETSTGNTFTAGAIDLTIGNDSYYTNEAGDLVSSATTSWAIGDLDGEVFFSFSDLKPGDIGEDTISINVDDNDAWACMANSITATPENGQTEPEAEDDDSDEADSGELQDELMFAAWHDDGDNVYENDERLYKLGGMNGPEIVSAQDMTGVQPLVDSTYNGFDVDNVGEPLTGGETYHIGKAWCLGDMTEAPIVQDGSTTTNPVDRGTGFDCSGASVDNKTQTDGITSNIQFYAVQSRNNDDFVCSNADFGGVENADNVTTNVQDAWSTVDTSNAGKAWFGKARWNNDANYEVNLGIDDNDSNTFNQSESAWVDGDVEGFTLTYDANNDNATLAFDDGTTVSYSSLPVGSFSNIGITIKAGESEETSVENLSLNVGSLTDTSITQVGFGTESLTINGVDSTNGFILTGDLKFSGDSDSDNQSGAENQKMQISVN
jgi:predicted ribosomally synthesized peptide with SipW-like signal peptide